MHQKVIDRVNAIGMSLDQPKLLTSHYQKGELVGDLLVIATIPGIPAIFNQNELDPQPDELQESLNVLQPHMLFAVDQIANLFDEPPAKVPLLMPLALESEIPEPINLEAVDATGLHCSTRTQAQPSSCIPSFTGKRHKAAALLFAQPEPAYAFVSHVNLTQSSSKAGLHKLYNGGSTVISQELTQLYLHNTFEPLHQKNLSSVEHRSALESHLFLKEKRDATVKGCMVAGVNKPRGTINKVAAPESLMLTAAIDAVEGPSVAIYDIPNAFVQTNVTPTILWVKLFLEAQSCTTGNTILYQDNQSAILCKIDFFTKPLQGKFFVKFRKSMMNLPD